MKRDADDSNDAPVTKSSKGGDSLNVVVRFLIPRRAAGMMIGKGGENIKKIRSQYNVRVNIPDCRGPERVMTCEGDLQAICDVMLESSSKLKEILNAKYSDPKHIMGQNARRPREGEDRVDDDNMLDYRILVHESQAGSVIGRGGDRIKDLRRKHRLRVIKVYEMRAPYSTDRVVQIVSEPESGLKCLHAVIEAVEAAPPRGHREDYNAANVNEMEALNYGGWLSPEAIQALSRGAMPPMDPYSMNGPMGGPMGGQMGGPMGGQMGGPMGGGYVEPSRGMGGGYVEPSRGMAGGRPSGGRSSFGRGGGYRDNAGGGRNNGNGAYSDRQQQYGQTSGDGYGGYGSGGGGGYGSSGAGAGYGSGGGGGYGSGGAAPPSGRGGTYGGWGTSQLSGGQNDSKASDWSGGWS